MTFHPPFLSADEISTWILEELRQSPPSSWLPSPGDATIRLLADGVYHVNFVVDAAGLKYVARFNRESQWGLSRSDQLSREFAVLKDLAKSDVAPAPIELFERGSKSFLVESLVSGTYISYAHHFKALGKSIARAHSCAPLESRDVLDATPAKECLVAGGEVLLDGCKVLPNDFGALILLRTAAGELARRELPESDGVLLHTDLIQKNILVNASGCKLVDWEGARLGSRAWDLAYCLSPVTLIWAEPEVILHPGEVEAFLRAYIDEAGVEYNELKAEIEAISPYVMFRALAWCYAYAGSNTTASGPDQQRLRRLVSPEFIDQTLMAAIA